MVLDPDLDSGITLENLSLSCRPGGLVVIEVTRGLSLRHLPLGDAAQGLIFPREGSVSFRGRSWADLTPPEADDARGRMGRVFDRPSWLSNLNVDENVTLSLRHHTTRDTEEIQDEANELSRRFRLEPPPALRPARVSAHRLRRYEWVRAFLGVPEVIVMENPLAGVYTESVALLVEAVEEFRSRGTGFLWITSDYHLLPEGSPPADSRFRVEAGGLTILGEDSTSTKN